MKDPLENHKVRPPPLRSRQAAETEAFFSPAGAKQASRVPLKSAFLLESSCESVKGRFFRQRHSE